MPRTYTFHIKGMHCASCIALTESELLELPEISYAKSSLNNHTVQVAGEFSGLAEEEITLKLNEKLKPHGYEVALEKETRSVNWSEFKMALPIAIGFVALFIFLQKLGIVNLVNSSEVGLGTAFVIGLIASVSTCMAVVGGLVLSMSANFAKEGDKIKPQIFFHVGRLVSFFVLGGLIGALGSAFQLGLTGNFILGLVVAMTLLVLGLNLLDVSPFFKRLQPTMPNFIGRRVHNVKSLNHTLTPVLVGVATFFLPCGFTQSMQIYTLAVGNFWDGAMIMLFFALGTLPVLALLSFSSLSIHKKTQSGVFFKTAGLVVVFFGLLNLVNSLVAFGVIPPFFNL